MTDLLKSGSAWLSGQMKAHAASTVTYKRGANSVSIAATKGRSEFEIVGGELADLVRADLSDWIVDADELILASVTVEPQIGDLVEETTGTVKRTYEVMAPAPRTAPWRYSDPYHERLRIHSKLIKVENT